MEENDGEQNKIIESSQLENDNNESGDGNDNDSYDTDVSENNNAIIEETAADALPKLDFKTKQIIFYILIVSIVLAIVGIIILYTSAIVTECEKESNICYKYSIFDTTFKVYFDLKKYLDGNFIENVAVKQFKFENYFPIIFPIILIIIGAITYISLRRQPIDETNNNAEFEDNEELINRSKRKKDFLIGISIFLFLLVLTFLFFFLRYLSNRVLETNIIENGDLHLNASGYVGYGFIFASLLSCTLGPVFLLENKNWKNKKKKKH